MKSYQVNTGFYSQHAMYHGESLFLAGLTTARANRDGTTYGLNAVTFFSPSHGDGESSGLDDDESHFLWECSAIGCGFENRKKVCR